MSRVVHVLEPDAPGCGPSTWRVLADLQSDDAVFVLGGRAAVKAVGDAGVVVTASVPTPLRTPRLAGRAVRRALVGCSPDRIVAWSESALVAALSSGTTTEVVGVVAAVEPRSPVIETSRREVAAVHPIGSETGPALVRRGWRLGSTIAAADLPVRGTDHPDRRHARRASIRGQWGIDDDRLVVAVTTDPVHGSDVSAAMTAAASAAVAGRGLCLVADPAGINAVASSHWLREGVGRFGGAPVGLVLDARVRDPKSIAYGIDVAAQVDFAPAVTFTPPSVVELRTWLACGVPVVASDRPNAASLVRDRVDGRLLPPGDRNAFVRVLTRLVDEPGLVTDMAHAAAATHGRGLPVRRPRWLSNSEDQSAGESSPENPIAASR
ncbi:MAG: hypothetical protein CMJ27_02380 [Phycisphaerae bacterium]|nr:hypothetical protein [Phycisphaerae bacterium]OUX02798.1 MAG: hypothetical protein CBD91_01710 [Phycisphaeraceae bacterium TMED231]